MGFTNNVEKNWLMCNNEKFLFSETFSDVTFDFGEGNLIYAHSLPLGFASEVFAAQLFGRMQQRNIDIKDATLEDFKTLLRFIYTGEMRLTLENMFQIAYLGQKYMIGKVTELVEFFFLEKAEDKKNFWSLFRPKEIHYFDGNRNISLRKLTRRFCECPLSYFDTEEFLLSDEETANFVFGDMDHILISEVCLTFTQVETSYLAEILRNEEMAINELDLYKAVLRWATHQSKGDPSSMREKVNNFIHSLRLPTLSWSELTTGLSIADSELLLPEEKQYLLSYCGGLRNVPMPFVKMPRQSSRDVLFATARKSRNEMTTRRTSTYFVPLAAYRFLGVTCNIRNNDLEPSKCCFQRTVSFELVKINRESQKEEPIGSFKYNGWDGSVFCPAEDIYLLCPRTMYKLHTTPGPTTSMCTYTDSFTLEMIFLLLVIMCRQAMACPVSEPEFWYKQHIFKPCKADDPIIVNEEHPGSSRNFYRYAGDLVNVMKYEASSYFLKCREGYGQNVTGNQGDWGYYFGGCLAVGENNEANYEIGLEFDYVAEELEEIGGVVYEGANVEYAGYRTACAILVNLDDAISSISSDDIGMYRPPLRSHIGCWYWDDATQKIHDVNFASGVWHGGIKWGDVTVEIECGMHTLYNTTADYPQYTWINYRQSN